MKRLFSIFLCLICAVAAMGQTKETHPFVERDSTLFLDVHRPALPRADKAVVVSVFGGGFVSGTRDDKLMRKTAELLTERGSIFSPSLFSSLMPLS